MNGLTGSGGAKPKIEVPWLYIVAGNRVRLRCNLVMAEGEGEKTFPAAAGNGTSTIYGRVWLICCGPVIRPRADEKITMKGFHSGIQVHHKTMLDEKRNE